MSTVGTGGFESQEIGPKKRIIETSDRTIELWGVSEIWHINWQELAFLAFGLKSEAVFALGGTANFGHG